MRNRHIARIKVDDPARGKKQVGPLLRWRTQRGAVIRRGSGGARKIYGDRRSELCGGAGEGSRSSRNEPPLIRSREVQTRVWIVGLCIGDRCSRSRRRRHARRKRNPCCCRRLPVAADGVRKGG